MGVEVRVEGLTKSFGKQVIWQDVSLTLPPGEISVLLGPSGTGKSVFLKHLVGLLKPDRGHVYVDDRDVPNLSEHDLYEVRKLFGVLFQDGALFGSMTLFDNVAFPLREHTKKSESEIKRIVMEKLEMVGLANAEKKLPGEISGGMRKRAGLARGLVLDPEILLFDEPDSGLDPVRVAYLNQLIVDINAQTNATMLIVTHDIGTARTVPDNIGLLFRRELVMFGPRHMLLDSDVPVVRQFLNGRMEGPIGMAEEKDEALVKQELANLESRSNGHEPADGPRPKGAGAGTGERIRPSGQARRDDPAPDLIEEEPAIRDRSAIAQERELAPEEGPVTAPRRPIDHETGEVLPRPADEHEGQVEPTGSAVDGEQDDTGRTERRSGRRKPTPRKPSRRGAESRSRSRARPADSDDRYAAEGRGVDDDPYGDEQEPRATSRLRSGRHE